MTSVSKIVYIDKLDDIVNKYNNTYYSQINPHMHKMDPGGPKQYIFGDQFYLKNPRMLRFHQFLHFYARKHMILSF